MFATRYRYLRIFLILGCVVCAFMACASAPPPETPVAEPAPAEAAPEPEPEPKPEPKVAAAPPQDPPSQSRPAGSSITAASAGFWPSPESSRPLLVLALAIGDAEALETWELAILPVGSTAAVRTYKAAGSEIRASISWDGRTDGGQPAPAGTYRARLRLAYGSAFQAASLESGSFILSRDPPKGSLTLDRKRLVPVEEGIAEPVHIAATATPALAAIAGWQIDVLDPAEEIFVRFDGELPVPAITWDGMNQAGNPVLPGVDYALVLTLRDEYGNVSVARAALSVDALPAVGQLPSIAPRALGLSPNGDGRFDSLAFSLGFPRPEAVSAWRIEIRNRSGALLRNFTGTADTALPATAMWNGKDDTGSIAPDGAYLAVLTVDHGRSFARESARSAEFLLDRTPPQLGLEVSPPLFSPDGDGRDDLLTLEGSASGGFAPAADWDLALLDLEGRPLAQFSGTGEAASVSWDGKPASGPGPDYAEDYGIVYRARDVLGNEARLDSFFATDFLVVPDAGGYRIAVPGIVFKPFTADWRDLAAELVAKNSATLNRIAKSLNRLPEYRIKLVGHAVMVYWDDEVRGPLEQVEELLPLSLARAEAIATALGERGVDPARFSLEGVGADRPLVPFGDLENRWQNRRVEFFLVRE